MKARPAVVKDPYKRFFKANFFNIYRSDNYMVYNNFY